MITERRQECFSCLSPGYLASRLFFIKLWFWFTLDVMDISPIRPWRGGESKFEDALLESFVLFCSNRFVTWGSVHQAKMHVVEFLRWTTRQRRF